MIGIKVWYDENESDDVVHCTPNLIIGEDNLPLSELTYEQTVTPVLESMDKRIGTVLGGDEITFTGTGFSTTETTNVWIDERSCAVTSQTETIIKCVTSNKPFRADEPTL